MAGRTPSFGLAHKLKALKEDLKKIEQRFLGLWLLKKLRFKDIREWDTKKGVVGLLEEKVVLGAWREGIKDLSQAREDDLE